MLLPGPIKNFKSSSPESMTSLRDRWEYLAPTHDFVREGASKVDELLKNNLIILPVDNVMPELRQILHSEMRERDIGVEFSELSRVKESSATEKKQAEVAIVKLQSNLIQKLQVRPKYLPLPL